MKSQVKVRISVMAAAIAATVTSLISSTGLQSDLTTHFQSNYMRPVVRWGGMWTVSEAERQAHGDQLRTRTPQQAASLQVSLRMKVTHLFFPTDVTDSGPRGRTGGGANDGDHALRQDLTHCERKPLLLPASLNI